MSNSLQVCVCQLNPLNLEADNSYGYPFANQTAQQDSGGGLQTQALQVRKTTKSFSIFRTLYM
jgi:hypothetical protein